MLATATASVSSNPSLNDPKSTVAHGPSLLFLAPGSNTSEQGEVDFGEWVHESDYEDEEQRPTLKSILGVPVITNTKGLLDHLFSNTGIGFNPKHLLEQLSLRANGGWKGLPDLRHWNMGPATAAKYLDLLATFSIKILSTVATDGTAEESIPMRLQNGTQRRWASTGQRGIRPIAKGELECEPSLVLLDKSPTTDQDQLDWTLVLGTLIYKSSDAFKVDAERECVEYAECMFLAQPFRRFVTTVLLINTTMTVTYFDRSGGLASEEIDVHKETEKFLRVVLGMLFVNRAGLGFDSTISSEGELTIVHVDDSQFELADRIHSSKRLEGKGTSCYSGKDKDGNIVVVKDSWVDIEIADNEVEILKHLNAPRPNASSDEVRRHEESLCTPDGVRVIPRLIAGQNVQVETHVIEDGVKKAFKRSSNTATIREALGLLRVEGDEPSTYVWSDPEFEGVVIRCHWRVVSSPMGARFDSSGVPTIGDIMLVAHDIIYAIKILRDRNIVHRDICDMNIVVQRHKGMARGLLIDFDSATHVSRIMNEAMPERRGTLEFMALDRLAPSIVAPHTYFHDLQSLFFVLCWFCSPAGKCPKCACGTSGVDSVRTRWSGFDYSPSTFESVLKAKSNDVLSDEDFERNIFGNPAGDQGNTEVASVGPGSKRTTLYCRDVQVQGCRRLLLGPWDYSAIARALLMPAILKKPQTDFCTVQRYTNLLFPSERSPTVVFLSMTESLIPRDLPGVSYNESAFEALIAKAVHEQYLRLYAIPNSSVMRKKMEKKVKERYANDDSERNNEESGENDGQGEDESDGGYLAEDLEAELEESAESFEKKFMASVNTRVNEAFWTLKEEHPEIFNAPTSADVYDQLHKLIGEYENSLNAFK